jgi:hypothetical protein
MNQLKIKMDVGGAIQIAPAAEAVEVKEAKGVLLTEEQIKAIKDRRAKLQKMEAEVKARQGEAEAELKAANERVMREVEKMRAKQKQQRSIPKAEQPKPAGGEKKDPLFD